MPCYYYSILFKVHQTREFVQLVVHCVYPNTFVYIRPTCTTYLFLYFDYSSSNMQPQIIMMMSLAMLLQCGYAEYRPPGPAYPCPKEADRHMLYPCVCEQGIIHQNILYEKYLTVLSVFVFLQSFIL